MTSLLSYIREGFRPQNPLLKNAGDPDDGSPDIGAVDMMNDIASGDIDGNGHMDLTDAIISLQFITGSSAINLNMQADVNQDNIIGIEETIYILQEISL